MPPRPRHDDPQHGRPDSPVIDGDGELDARLVRPADLLDARLLAPGCTLDDGDDGPVLVAHGDDAALVLVLPPQHVGERAWQEGTTPGAVSAHRAAAASRLVFALADGAVVPFTLAGVLTVLPTLPLRVAPHATAASAEGPGRPVTPGWADVVLVPGWRDRLVRGVTLTDLVVGDGQAAALASTRLAGAVSAVVGHAQAARLVRGHAGATLAAPAAGTSVAGAAAASPAGGRAARLPGMLGRLVPGHVLHPGVRPRRGPRPPSGTETAIEAPYRVTVSPSALGAFRHEVEPITAEGDESRVELWRTHLTVRATDAAGAFTGHDDTDEAQRIVRAIWSRDMDALDATALTDPAPLAPQSLVPPWRRSLVRQSSDVRTGVPPEPFEVRSLALSSLGAWIDWAGTWDPLAIGPAPEPLLAPPIESYRHQAVMGRDSYVRVTEPGFLYPFGHRAVWVTVSERKVLDRSQGVAYLWRRNFIIVRQPSRSFAGHDTPLGQVTLEPLVTPNLDPANLATPFVPTQDGTPYRFTLVGVDQAGRTVTFSAPLAFVSLLSVQATVGTAIDAAAEAAYAPVRKVPGRGQSVTMARSATPGDTTLEVNDLQFRGVVDRDHLTSRPFLVQTNAVVPSMRHLAPQSPGVELGFSAPFLAADAGGFGAANPGQLFLTLLGSPPAVDFSGGSDRSGGFLTPNLAVRALSRSLGAVGEDGTGPTSGLAQGRFDPARFLEGALPKLFGLFSLLDLLDALGVGLDDAPEFVTEALDTVSAIVTEADRLRTAAAEAGPRLVQEAAGAAHDGARAAIDAARAQLDAAVGPLLASLDTLVDTVTALPGAADPIAAVGDVVAALGVAADRVDDLLAALGAPQLPAMVRAALERPATALATLARAADTLEALQSFVEDLLSPGTSVTARFVWNPQIRSWPAGSPVFEARDPRGLRLAIEVRASASTPPSVDVAAELADFALVLLPGEPLMAMTFQRIGFRVGSGGKPEVDVVFGGMEFLGVLSFVDTLRRMIPFDGFADPPFVDVSPEGVTAGFDLALPNVSVGVFSLENIALGADARVPFLGDAVTIGFTFCSKESPFRLTVMMVGGGGWVALRASPKGLVLLEVGLEATACLSIDLGVASGSLSVAVGVYLRLEGDKGSLTAYFRLRGEVDVLGLISASITLELSLEYEFDTGKLVGRASLVIEVEVLFFSASVEVSVERRLAGSKGDPVLADILPPAPDGTNADWSAYCEAFVTAA